jgi:predicted dehydrogenase
MAGMTLRIGIIGADTKASWAGVSHIPAIQGLDEVTLAAVATRHEESAREAAAAFGVSTWYADPYALIEDDSVDVVTVAVKVPAHRDLVLAALDAGKIVYCEAPLGVSVEETRELAEAAGSRLSAVGLQGRLNPAVRRAAELIAGGAIGRPLNARVLSTSAGGAPVTSSAYAYFERPGSGANLLTIGGGHTLDIVEALLGELTEVDARAGTFWPRPTLIETGEETTREVPDHVDILGTTAAGTAIAVSVSGAPAPEEATFRFELRGTDGWLTLTGGALYGVQGGDLRLTSSASFSPVPRPAFSGPAINVASLYASLARDAATGSRDTPGFAHALHNARLMSAVATAASSGVRQTL